MHTPKVIIFAVGSLALAGCSAKDPVTQTPVFHVGTPTNRASVNSWELAQAGINLQPGHYAGKRVTLPFIPSQRGLEPGDPLAVAVSSTLAADSRLSTRYLEVSAKNGHVLLIGSVTNATQKKLAVQIARHVRGVKTLESKITVMPAS